MRTTLAAGCIAAAATPAAAQTIDFLNANAGGGPVVRNAPYSGEGVTTVRQVLYDGTRIERTVTATIHRDSAGRGALPFDGNGIAGDGGNHGLAIG